MLARESPVPLIRPTQVGTSTPVSRVDLWGPSTVKLAESDAKKLGQEEVNVDLLLFSKKGYALTEVKWTRQSLPNSLELGKTCIPKLRAATRGRWSRGSRKLVTAKLVGVLAVSPSAWTLEAKSTVSAWGATISSSDDVEDRRVRKRKSGVSNWKGSGVSNWEDWRGDARPGDAPLWPSHRAFSPEWILGGF